MSAVAPVPSSSPWHAGELSLQARVGVVERMDEVGRRVVRPYLTGQHRAFFALLPMVVAGVVAPDGNAWATLLWNAPGFLSSTDAKTLHVEARPDANDPAVEGFVEGASVGLLGIELSTRRRNRLNGVVRESGSGFSVDVLQSFGNCDRFIQRRDFEFVRDPTGPGVPRPSDNATKLTPRAREMISSADTFFVASFVERENGPLEVDVSHRGGRAGFVRIDDAGTLTVPDFGGNLFFSTLGNFLMNPKAGLLFTDFETGDVLQLSGSVEVILESPEIAQFSGAERLWRFTPQQVVLRPAASPAVFRMGADPWSPATLATGAWPAGPARTNEAAVADRWRPMRIVRIVDESSVVRSLHLEPDDGVDLVGYRSGQYLPIRVRTRNGDKPTIRYYTLSTAASGKLYRISVRRDGLVSQHLHDHLKVGDVIEARAPAGAFTIDALASRPVVLVSAGVGVTPMLAMLHEIVSEGLRVGRTRPTWFFQAARSLAERAFSEEIGALALQGGEAVHVVRSLADAGDAKAGDYELTGRLTLGRMKSRLPFDDYDFYVCGPAAFMESLRSDLRSLNVPEDRLHFESFGAKAERWEGGPRGTTGSPVKATVPASAMVPVVFAVTGVEAAWIPTIGSLLALAESRGLAPEFSCRMGVCGTCRAKVREGAVAYPVEPGFKVENDEALLCCAVPALDEKCLVIDI